MRPLSSSGIANGQAGQSPNGTSVKLSTSQLYPQISGASLPIPAARLPRYVGTLLGAVPVKCEGSPMFHPRCQHRAAPRTVNATRFVRVEVLRQGPLSVAPRPLTPIRALRALYGHPGVSPLVMCDPAVGVQPVQSLHDILGADVGADGGTRLRTNESQTTAAMNVYHLPVVEE